MFFSLTFPLMLHCRMGRKRKEEQDKDLKEMGFLGEKNEERQRHVGN